MPNETRAALTMRQRAIFQGVWKIPKHEVELLDKFFLIRESWAMLKPDLLFSEEKAAFFLRHEGVDYQVYLLESLPALERAKELGLSFRVNYRSNMNIVVVKEWFELPQNNGE